MNESDYDKYYKKGGTYVIPVEAFNELFNELERLSINYEQALEDLDKKDNIINEIQKNYKEKILEVMEKNDIKSFETNDSDKSFYCYQRDCIEEKIKELEKSDKE